MRLWEGVTKRLLSPYPALLLRGKFQSGFPFSSPQLIRIVGVRTFYTSPISRWSNNSSSRSFNSAWNPLNRFPRFTPFADHPNSSTSQENHRADSPNTSSHASAGFNNRSEEHVNLLQVNVVHSRCGSRCYRYYSIDTRYVTTVLWICNNRIDMLQVYHRHVIIILCTFVMTV